MKESNGNAKNLAFIQLTFIYLPVPAILLSLVVKFGRKVYSKYNKQLQQDHLIVSHCAVDKTGEITHTSVELQLSAPLLIEGTPIEDYTA